MEFKRIGNAFVAIDRITRVEILEQDFGPNGTEEYLKVTLDDDVTFELSGYEAKRDPFFKQFFTSRFVRF